MVGNALTHLFLCQQNRLSKFRRKTKVIQVSYFLLASIVLRAYVMFYFLASFQRAQKTPSKDQSGWIIELLPCWSNETCSTQFKFVFLPSKKNILTYWIGWKNEKNLCSFTMHLLPPPSLLVWLTLSFSQFIFVCSTIPTLLSALNVGGTDTSLKLMKLIWKS